MLFWQNWGRPALDDLMGTAWWKHVQSYPLGQAGVAPDFWSSGWDRLCKGFTSWGSPAIPVYDMQATFTDANPFTRDLYPEKFDPEGHYEQLSIDYSIYVAYTLPSYLVRAKVKMATSLLKLILFKR